MNKYKLNFLANAIGDKYEEFLIPFTFFALNKNPNSFVEIIVLNSNKFKNKYKNEIIFLEKDYKNRFLIRNMQNKLNNNVKNTYRFFEVPTVDAEYTYICDVDIIILDDIIPKFEENWISPLPYSNIIRPKANRLSGCHLVKTNQYYTLKYKQIQQKYHKLNQKKNDEQILFNMVKECHKLISRSAKFRPIYGIHFSPNRGKNKSMNLVTRIKWKDEFTNLYDSNNLSQFNCFKKLFISLNKNFIIK